VYQLLLVSIFIPTFVIPNYLHMAKVTLEFDSVEQAAELKAALDGYKWAVVLWELDQALRQTTKHGFSLLDKGQATDIEYKVADKYREMIREILEEHKLFFD
jgi:hypothetical protein